MACASAAALLVGVVRFPIHGDTGVLHPRFSPQSITVAKGEQAAARQGDDVPERMQTGSTHGVDLAIGHIQLPIITA